MEITWDEEKRKTNIQKHGLDFADAKTVLDGPVFYKPDESQNTEERWIVFGRLEQETVALVLTERTEQIRIISMRLATNQERKEFEREWVRETGRKDWKIE